MSDLLRIETLQVGSYLTNCYIVHANGRGIVIDPGDEAQRIIFLIKKQNLKIEKIILTHGHIDHILALPEIKKYTGAPILIHPDDAIMLTDPAANLSVYHGLSFSTEPAETMLNEGDIIEFGVYEFKILHTPGHTPGGISLVIEKSAFTGDALFAGSIGRTDFPGSNHQTLIDSIRRKLLALPDETIVYPGHGPATTIGEEREMNPWLA
jgi:hydroxyacylglutathione hydrolase